MAKPKTKKKIENVTPAGLHKALNQRWPNSTRMGNDPSLRIQRIPTGILSVDYLLGGGFARNRHAELYGDYCVVPETRILTRDLSWIPAGDLDQEDEIIGFDEELNQGRGRSSTFQPSMVTSAGIQKLHCYRIITTTGDVIVSRKHKFVIRRERETSLNFDRMPRHHWKKACDLEIGDLIMSIGGEPWNEDRSYDSGWLSGFLDGEGWCADGRVCVGQLPGLALDNAKRILKERGFDFSTGEQGNGVIRVAIRGGKYETWKLLGSIRPVRILNKAEQFWIDRSIAHKGPGYTYEDGVARVLAIEPVGRKEVVPLQTSTGTLITEGLLSHNSTGKTATALRFIGNAQRMGLTCAYVNAENSYDPVFARHLGVKNKKLNLHDQETGEQCIDYMQTLLEAGLHDVIVLDSIAALLPMAEREASAENKSYGMQQAKLMSAAMRKLTTCNRRTAIIYINQTRDSIGSVFIQQKVTSGGRAMGFYAGVRLEFTTIETIKTPGTKINLKTGATEKADLPAGHRVQLRVRKDKTGGARRDDMSTFVFDYDLGNIDPIEDLIFVGQSLGLVFRRDDNWWVEGYQDERQNGRKRFKRWLDKNVLVQQDLGESIAKLIKKGNSGAE